MLQLSIDVCFNLNPNSYHGEGKKVLVHVSEMT